MSAIPTMQPWQPLPPDKQPLTPHESYRQMAESICQQSTIAHDFLRKCEACGLPVDDRLAELQQHTEFCRNFLKHFYDV